MRSSARSGKGIAGALLVAIGLAGCEPEPQAVQANMPYSREFPAVGYAESELTGRVSQLLAAVSDNHGMLEFQRGRGYLEAALDALEIDASSQVLVFSRTSLQVAPIGPSTPRAIYFNDDTYVAYTPGGPTLEIASYDPAVGPVFHTLLQEDRAEPLIEREFRTCLRCHDTYSLTGGGVPRFLLGSGYTGTDGELVSHEAWILTSQSTPLRSRWGGWYVTGRHGEQSHLGNIVVERAEDLQNLDAIRVGNVDELGGLFDTSPYPTPYSDIVALLVLEHQIEVQNRISRLLFEATGSGERAGDDSLDAHVDALVRSMLMVDAIEFDMPIEGGSGFREWFESLGPFDSRGRSLRNLDLTRRLFEHPLSYLIYSDAFAGLPDHARVAVYGRLQAVFDATPAQDGFANLTLADRSTLREILTETLPEFPAE